uniref:Similarity to N-acetyl neuramic acid synthetase NeuB n=1 Tax=Kuenenia stuttgartiensis TaxID=174633 RepID=Q1PVV9_KUEST|nr:similarity to N-acetyl neuramic acid synthetase NeuB [Candidatus Kuenenia stuttgartiensis]
MKNLKKYGFSTDNKVYVIAEIGLNHGGDMNTAKRLIDSASKTGVDAVKFQTYLTEKRVPKNSPIFDILKKCELPFEVFKELKDYTETYNIEFFSTPFDEESVDFLESVNCALYKVASFDVVNYKLLSKIADTKKTIIMSVGMANLSEIEGAFKILKNKTDKLAIMHCVSAYPTKEEDANLSAIYTLKDKFDCIIGQSDHTAGVTVPLYAIAAGAQIIEKHYKIDEDMNCVDAPVSITEEQMRNLIKEIRRLESILGNGEFGVRAAEAGCKIFRRHSK